jgi:hypothetical protein
MIDTYLNMILQPKHPLNHIVRYHNFCKCYILEFQTMPLLNLTPNQTYIDTEGRKKQTKLLFQRPLVTRSHKKE